jgi:hypothetical protein
LESAPGGLLWLNTAGKQFDLRIDANSLKITSTIPE